MTSPNNVGPVLRARCGPGRLLAAVRLSLGSFLQTLTPLYVHGCCQALRKPTGFHPVSASPCQDSNDSAERAVYRAPVSWGCACLRTERGWLDAGSTVQLAPPAAPPASKHSRQRRGWSPAGPPCPGATRACGCRSPEPPGVEGPALRPFSLTVALLRDSEVKIKMCGSCFPIFPLASAAGAGGCDRERCGHRGVTGRGAVDAAAAGSSSPEGGELEV